MAAGREDPPDARVAEGRVEVGQAGLVGGPAGEVGDGIGDDRTRDLRRARTRATGWSARWQGQVEAPSTEAYTFYVNSDDGVRLWVNGQLIVSNWTDHAAVENSGTIALSGGQRYDIRMEYYERGGQATARLLWSSPSTAKAVIPTARRS